MPPKLADRAPLRSVIKGEAPLVGARAASGQPRGYVSPVEPRILLGLPVDDPAAVEAAYLADRTALRDLGVLARTALASALFSDASAPSVPRPYVVSARVDNVSAREALDAILAPPPDGRARLVHFVHPHALNLAARDSALADRLARADLVLPDGVGLRLAAELLGTPLRENVNGTDLLPTLCREAAARGVPLVLVGGAPGVAEACAAALREAHPGLSLPVVSHGFLDAAAVAAVREQIRALPRAVVLVGMGSPLQEAFAWNHLADLPGVTALTVGGLFDFYSGRIPRAPAALREAGLEWVWRLAIEPRRLARRYILGNPLFLARASLQRLARRQETP